MKKLLSVFLAAVMAAGLTPGAALAEEEAPTPESVEASAEEATPVELEIEPPEEEEEAPAVAADEDGDEPAEELVYDEPDEPVDAPKLGETDLGELPEDLFSIRRTDTNGQYLRNGNSFTFVLEVDNTKLTDPDPNGDNYKPCITSFEYELVIRDDDEYRLTTAEMTDLLGTVAVSYAANSPIQGRTTQSFGAETMSGYVLGTTTIDNASDKRDYLQFTIPIGASTVAEGLNRDYTVSLLVKNVSFVYPPAEGETEPENYVFGSGEDADSVELASSAVAITPETADFRIAASMATQNTYISAGGTFSVSFSLPVGTPYAGMDGILTYDHTYLTLQSYTWGSFSSLDIMDMSNISADRIGFVLFTNGNNTAAATPIFTATFQASQSLSDYTEQDLSVGWEPLEFYEWRSGEEYTRRPLASPLTLPVSDAVLVMESVSSITMGQEGREFLVADDELVVKLTIPGGLGVSSLTGAISYDHDALTCTGYEFGWTGNNLQKTFTSATGAVDIHTTNNSYYTIPENTPFLTLKFAFDPDYNYLSYASYNAATNTWSNVDGSFLITWTQTSFVNDSPDEEKVDSVVLDPITVEYVNICPGNVTGKYEIVDDHRVPIVNEYDLTVLDMFMSLSDTAKQQAVANKRFTYTYRDASTNEPKSVNVNFFSINACLSGGAWSNGRAPESNDLGIMIHYLTDNRRDQSVISKFSNISGT